MKASFKEALIIRNETLAKGLVTTEDGNPHHAVPSPICISGTILAEGRGKLLILCIGENSVEGRVSDFLSRTSLILHCSSNLTRWLI